MSALLNSIFFIKKEHLNINNVLNVLQNFMLTKANHAAILLRSKFQVTNGRLLLTNESSDSEDDEPREKKQEKKQEQKQEEKKEVNIQKVTLNTNNIYVENKGEEVKSVEDSTEEINASLNTEKVSVKS